jgi:hypothetical protein
MIFTIINNTILKLYAGIVPIFDYAYGSNS